ncbi:MAG: hypothetical protein LBO81_03700 [Clostridiales Family XIII bacterium]|jgi:hypothetical protein|nr:hypothetical protein [Clostridiales Family XIII bacterium]
MITMITEKDGFVPKATVSANPLSSNLGSAASFPQTSGGRFSASLSTTVRKATWLSSELSTTVKHCYLILRIAITSFSGLKNRGLNYEILLSRMNSRLLFAWKTWAGQQARLWGI